jgi:hypothetical protein
MPPAQQVRATLRRRGPLANSERMLRAPRAARACGGRSSSHRAARTGRLRIAAGLTGPHRSSGCLPRRAPHTPTQAPALGSLPDAAHAAILAALAAADRRALRRASRACRDAVDAAAGGVTVSFDLLGPRDGFLRRGAAPGRVRDVLRRFRGAAAIEFCGDGGGAYQAGACQAGAVELLAALSRWAGAEPVGRGCWPGVARIAGCPSMSMPWLAELCPNVARVELAAWDASGVLLPGALRALPSLSRLTELRITAGRGSGTLVTFDDDLGMFGKLTSLQRLVLDTPLQERSWPRTLCPYITGLTGLTHLQLPVSSRQLSALSALTNLRSYVAGQGASPLEAHGLPRFQDLTSLECAAPSLVLARLLPYTAEAPGPNLARLEVPGAALGPAQLSALAAACPNLTRLAALSLAALPDEAPVSVLPELRELACAFDPQFSTPLKEIAPRLDRLELKAGEFGAPRDLALVHVVDPIEGEFTLELVDPLCQYTRDGGSSDGGFSFINEDWMSALHALKLAAPLREADGDTANRRAAFELFQACEAQSPPGYPLTELWLRTDRPALILGVAAGTIAQSLVSLHLVSLPDTCAGTLVVAVCLFRCLERVTLEEGHEDGGALRYLEDHALVDAHLLQLEASRPDSLARVTLRRVLCVSREGADAAERRAAARGVPLEVVMEECW